LQQIGGFRSGLEGAQEYDLVLRALEHISPHQVVHIPRVLYHRRAITGSTVQSVGEKNYASKARRKAVTEHLQRRGVAAQVLPAPEAPDFNRVRYASPEPLPLVSIIIPTRDRADLLSVCLNSIIERSSYPNYEIIIIDNGSVEPDTKQLFERLPKDRCRIVCDDSPFNFSALNNLGVRVARGEMLCLMNNDIEILTTDWLEEMVSWALRPDVGCVGARLWYPDGRLQHGGVILGIGGAVGHSLGYLMRGAGGYFHRAVLHQELSAVTAACLLVRRTVFEHVNGLNEDLALTFNDIDFCLRVREAGYHNVWTPYAEMNHHESASRGYDDTLEKQARFNSELQFMQERWGGLFMNDPAYSPNLTLEREDFSYAWPPRVE
jgi:GT2 family glycosyltransferase